MTEKAIYGVCGASGFGREVMPLVKKQIGKDASVFFIELSSLLEDINGVNVITYEDFLQIDCPNKFVTIAIADSKIRERIVYKIISDDIKLFDVKADNVVILDDVKLSEGSILCPFVTLTSNIEIGYSFHANIYSYVGHDCKIGNYVTFAPAVKCNGNVVIEDHVYIGTGAIIKQGTPQKPIVIGEGAVVGMGAVVTKSVKSGDVVFGCPAKSIKRG